MLAVVVLAVVVVVRWLQRWLPSLGVLKMGLSKLPRRSRHPLTVWPLRHVAQLTVTVK